MPDRREVLANLLVDALYAFAIGINVYLIVDQMTDGELTRQVNAYMEQLRQRVGAYKQHRKDVAHVLFEAETIVEDAG